MVPSWVAWITLIITTPIYFLIHLYLEAIIPDAYGITKPCCYCFKRETRAKVQEKNEIVASPAFEEIEFADEEN